LSSPYKLDLAIVGLMIDRCAGLQLCEQLSGTVAVLAVSALDQEERALAPEHKPSCANHSSRWCSFPPYAI
jgi:hypothetical protein